jgi:hypothetical protein
MEEKDWEAAAAIEENPSARRSRRMHSHPCLRRRQEEGTMPTLHG